MAAEVLVDRATPTSFPTSCAACQVDLQHPKTASHICGKCSRKYCSTCYSLKMQLENGTEDEPLSSRNCSTCDRLIQIIMSQKTDDLDDSQTNISRNDRDHWSTGPPRKPARSNKTRGNTLTSNADKVSYYPHQRSEIQNGDPDSWSHGADDDFGGFYPRTPVQRDERGFASRSRVPGYYDNRYEILNSERNEANLSEKHGKSVQNQNFGRYSNFGQQNQKAHTPPLSYNGTGQHPNYPYYDDWNEELEDREAPDEFFQDAQSFMHEKGHPDYNRTRFEQYPRSRSLESNVSRHYNPRETMSHQNDNNPPIFGKHPHTAGVPNTTRAGGSYRGGYYDDLLLQEDDIEDLVNVPAIDDIPYALFLAGKVDRKTLIKATQKQQQLEMLKLFNEGREQSAKPKWSKNKNSGLRRNTEEGNVTTDEILANKTTNHTEFIHDKGKTPSGSMQPYIEKSERQNHSKINSHMKLEEAPLLVTGADKKVSLQVPEEKERKHSSIVDVNENGTNSSETTKKNTCSGDSGSKEPKQHLDSDKTETEKERFIREKRLQVLNSGQSIKGVGKNKNVETSTTKVSNRDKSYLLQDSQKPVKSKAFKSPVPSFQSLTGHTSSNDRRNTTNQTHIPSNSYKYQTNQGHDALEKSAKVREMIDNNAESGNRSKSKTISETKCHDESGEYDESDSESAPVPLAMRLLMNNSISNCKSDNTTSATDSETATEPTAMRLLREANAARERQKELTDIFPKVSTFKDDTESRNPEEPTAMRLLRQANTAKENKKVLREMISRVATGQDDEEPQNPNEPTAMRLLRQTKTMNERMKALTADTGSSGNNPMVALLSSLLGPPPSDFDPFTRADSSLADRSSPMKKPNKNKNINKKSTLKSVNLPKGENRLEKYGSHEEPYDIHGGNRTRVVRIMGLNSEDEAEGNIDGSKRSERRNTTEGTSVLLIAKTRHKVFQKLKLAKGEAGVRCTGCGRADCQSQNIRKMKEVIQIAQQAGFEVRDVIPDGNCMFAAVVDQLNMYGDNRFGHKSLREAAVTWLIEHPYNEDGTHYSSFMSEEWETYIQRMMAEGEWGDHVVLRAVVEVVGHTIKVLNVSENESHWTIMEPVYIDASRDNVHLVLGHVGEFHYISLRPCEKKVLSSPSIPVRQESVLAEDVAQVKLEGTESVNMFKEDYIDVWSEMPVPHFSFLLTRIIPMKVMENAAILSSQFLETPKNLKKIVSDGIEIPTTIEYGGSIAEAVYCSNLYAKVHEDSTLYDEVSFDVYGIMTNHAVVEQSRDSRQGEDYVLDTSGVHAGYAKILKTTLFVGGQKMNLLSSAFKIMDQTQGRNQSLPLKLIPAFKCLCWPEIAKPWVARERLEGWPSEAMISEVVSDGCLLTPFPHSASKSPNIEWQLSFALTERKLFRDGVSKHQKYCYILFDALCKQTMRSLKISSSHLKSVFFYACERIPLEFWETSPGACVLYMLDELLRYVNAKNLPNYFIQSNNMIDHLRDAELKEIEEQLILLRSQPVLFLRQIDEGLGMLPLSKSIIDKVSSDFQVFKAHRSVRTSTLEVFIPETIKVAQQYITGFQFELGFNMLSQAFQDRLSVSTCDDSVPFNVFLQGAVSGLDLTSVVWFSAYADKQLQGQLPMSLMRETCGEMTLVKIKEFLPNDVAGSYSDTEVPLVLARQLCSFCHDYARFLFSINKMSEILPVLYHCHAIYPEKFASAHSIQNGQVAGDTENKSTEDNDFTDEAMFSIYTAMFYVYYRQHQLEFFRSLLPMIETVCDRINKRWAFSCLAQMYTDLQDQEGVNRISQKFSHAPHDPLDTFRVQLFKLWPNYRLDILLSNQIRKSHQQQTGATNYQ